ncbi:MAG: hypothetical protein KME59_23300 [Trichormus sp. ATA11-4-KO1]|nr:hypothetical protein [Trichormus sp. ATA11-4-KO1]
MSRETFVPLLIETKRHSTVKSVDAIAYQSNSKITVTSQLVDFTACQTVNWLST